MVGFLIPAITIGATVALAWPLGRYMKWAMDPDGAGPNRQRYESIMHQNPQDSGRRAGKTGSSIAFRCSHSMS